MILGSLYLIAWNLGFPTETEDHLAWRGASLILAGGSLAFFGMYTQVIGLPGLGGEGKLCRRSICIHLGYRVLGAPCGIDAPAFVLYSALLTGQSPGLAIFLAPRLPCPPLIRAYYNHVSPCTQLSLDR